MKSRTATTTTSSGILHPSVVQPSVTYAAVMICTGLFLCSPGEASAALPTVDEFREDFRISESDKQRIEVTHSLNVPAIISWAKKQR